MHILEYLAGVPIFIAVNYDIATAKYFVNTNKNNTQLKVMSLKDQIIGTIRDHRKSITVISSR